MISLRRLPILLFFSSTVFFSSFPHAQAGIVHNPTGQNPPGHLVTMNYWGGPVVQKAKVVAVFWGNNVSKDTTTKIRPFLKALTNSTYIDFMNSEYNTNFPQMNGHDGTQQSIDRGSFSGAFQINPMNTSTALYDGPGDWEISAELEHQIAIGVLPANDANTDYIVYMPPDVSVNFDGYPSCKDYCAYHGAIPVPGTPTGKNGYLNYAVIIDTTKKGCYSCVTNFSAGNSFNMTTYLTSNQIAAGITDPEVNPLGTSGGEFPESWIGTDGQTEIGTFCSYNNPPSQANLKTKVNSYLVQPLWSLKNAACTTSNFTSP